MKYLKIKNINIRLKISRFEKKKIIAKFLFKNSFNDLKFFKNKAFSIIFFNKYLLNNKTRVKSNQRCLLTNRSRGVFKKFNFSRFILRDYMQFGIIPGYSKSVW